MNLSEITNPQELKAIEALQTNDKQAWYSCFTDDAVFTDDDREMNFRSFFDNAFANKERFLELDTVTDDGKVLYGKFYAGQWGTFRVFFKFGEAVSGKFNRLDIGQA